MPDTSRWARSPSAQGVSSREALVLVGQKGRSIAFEGESGDLAAAVLDYLIAPRSRSEVVEFVRSIAENAFEETVIDDLLRAFTEADIAVREESPLAREPIRPPSAPRHRRVVLAITGAIAAIDAPRMAIALQARGHEVWAVTTRAASRFVSREALSAITHKPAHSSLWGGSRESPVPHIALAEWADLVIVYPASASTISRIAQGDCSDLVSAVAIATRAPVLIAPSMNSAMLTAPSVARNLSTLRDDGFHVVHSTPGIEVADDPRERMKRAGPALGPDAFVKLLGIIEGRLNRRDRPDSSDSSSSSNHVDWERIHREVAPAEQPWHSDGPDAVTANEMDRCPSPSSWLDIGTGYGTMAIAAANRGHHVVATDLSSHVLELARTRAGSLPIVFVRDDLRSSNLMGSFDVVSDRGMMHVLDSSLVPSYAKTLERLVRIGGRLLLTVDATNAPSDRNTLRFDLPGLASLFSGFDLVRSHRTAITRGESDTAWLCVLERVDR